MTARPFRLAAPFAALLSAPLFAAFLVAAVLLLPAPCAAEGDAPAAGTLRVDVAVRNDKGQVGCMLFAQPKGWPNARESAAQAVFARIAGGRASCLFTSVAAGSYAISLMHDENGNGKLDKGTFGVPTEGYGFSNGAKSHTFTPARFDEATFHYGGDGTAVTIPVVYP